MLIHPCSRVEKVGFSFEFYLVPYCENLQYPDHQATDQNTLVFRLNVACDVSNVENWSRENPVVSSGDLVWVPQGEQGELQMFKAKPPSATIANVVLAKLRPGQAVNMELHAIKGIGKNHAKWKIGRAHV